METHLASTSSSLSWCWTGRIPAPPVFGAIPESMVRARLSRTLLYSQETQKSGFNWSTRCTANEFTHLSHAPAFPFPGLCGASQLWIPQHIFTCTRANMNAWNRGFWRPFPTQNIPWSSNRGLFLVAAIKGICSSIYWTLEHWEVSQRSPIQFQNIPDPAQQNKPTLLEATSPMLRPRGRGWSGQNCLLCKRRRLSMNLRTNN